MSHTFNAMEDHEQLINNVLQDEIKCAIKEGIQLELKVNLNYGTKMKHAYLKDIPPHHNPIYPTK